MYSVLEKGGECLQASSVTAGCTAPSCQTGQGMKARCTLVISCIGSTLLIVIDEHKRFNSAYRRRSYIIAWLLHSEEKKNKNSLKKKL